MNRTGSTDDVTGDVTGDSGTDPRTFASDNFAGVHPEIVEAIAGANRGHAAAYGADRWTAAAGERFREHFGPDAEAFPVFNGTGANVLSVLALCRPWQGVICAGTAHLNVDECGAPERIAGVKLLTLPAEHGKLTPELLVSRIGRIGDEHAVQPRLVSISNSTEAGTVYTPEETAAIADAARARGLLLHIDGARIANAAAALDVPLRALSTDAGADVLSFGGTKNGLLLGEAVVLLRPGLADELPYLRKQSMQLASKMRFISAQLDALLRGDLWLRNARHANEMARRLHDAIAGLPGIEIAHPVEANAVFARLPADAIPRLCEGLPGDHPFHVWDERSGVIRLMCAWDTRPEEVDRLAEALRLALQ